MILGDEGKPMTIFERISDEPCDPRPYLDYALKNIQGRIDYWKEKAPEGKWWDINADQTVACVVANLKWALHFLEDLKWKQQRAIERDAMPAGRAGSVLGSRDVPRG